MLVAEKSVSFGGPGINMAFEILVLGFLARICSSCPLGTMRDLQSCRIMDVQNSDQRETAVHFLFILPYPSSSHSLGKMGVQDCFRRLGVQDL